MRLARMLVMGAVVGAPAVALADDNELPDSRIQIYGFTMLDGGFDFGKIGDPLWEDVVRPTKLPAFENEFGKGPRTFWSVRQTRFGVKGDLPVLGHDLETTFEFELFGVGVEAGQTTFRLRHAYGQWGQFRAGQTWSPFMDIDVFPNSIEYWGPNGMVFYRNVQFAWMPIQGDSRITIAAERPGFTPDGGAYRDRVELEGITPRSPMPDFSAEFRYGSSTWGYVEAAGIIRWLKWDDLALAPPNLGGNQVGWGVNVSSNLKLDRFVLKLQAVYGAGIENYMNDAGPDVAPKLTPNGPNVAKGHALPVLGLVAFVDANWCKELTSTAGWSYVRMWNSDGQAPEDFHSGHYALANLLYHPHPRFMVGPEFQYGRRTNFSDGFSVNDFRVQASMKVNFDASFGGAK